MISESTPAEERTKSGAAVEGREYALGTCRTLGLTGLDAWAVGIVRNEAGVIVVAASLGRTETRPSLHVCHREVRIAPQGARTEERAPSRRLVESGKHALCICRTLGPAARNVGAV